MCSEMLVDWLKHAFITKFNHIRPSVYERYADVLCRDLTSGSAVGRRGARKVFTPSDVLLLYLLTLILAFVCGPVTPRCPSAWVRLVAISGPCYPRWISVNQPYVFRSWRAIVLPLAPSFNL